ncbi:MAG TPA: hypothetical protein VGG62_14960 [Terracidiphilus sp.]
MSIILQLLSQFRCRHPRLTFPRMLPDRSGHYVVCRECGKEFHYDWGRMKLGRERVAPAAQKRTVQMFTIKLIDRVDGEPTEYDGKYLVDYDPTPRRDGEGEFVHLIVTEARDQARQFSTLDEALRFYRLASRNGPRADGEPDRPLTAYSAEIA